MEQRDAQEIVRMVESGWSFDLGPEGRKLWRELLEPYDAETATRALIGLVKHQPRRPTFADLRSAIMRLHTDRVEAEAWRELPTSPIGRPSWVTRWEQARAVGDYRPLPEQAPGFMALQSQAGQPLNARAYQLPTATQDAASEWIQPDEYQLEAAS